MLRGADLEATSRKYRVTAATLSQWRDHFLAGGEASLKSRQTDVQDEEKRRLKSVVASISVDNELLREKIACLENGRPLAFLEVETMSRTVSPSSNRPYGVARVVQVWGMARSSFYAARQRQQEPRDPHKRGPKVRSDGELLAETRQLLAEPVFVGEG